jgi:hypothetical protein
MEKKPTHTKRADKSQSENYDDWPGAEDWINEKEADTLKPTKRLKKRSAGEGSEVIDEFASRIAALWYRSTEAILETATACADAATRLNAGQKNMLLEKLPFGVSTFSKLVQIGANKRIPKIIKRLPPSMSTIYEVALLSNEQLKVGIETGIVSADATRDDIKLFRESHEPEPKAGGPLKPPGGRRGTTNKAQDSVERSRRMPSEPDDDFDLNFDDDEECSDDDQVGSEESVEGDDAYDALVDEWEDEGLLRRRTWQATPENIRQKFTEKKLRREPFKPAA